MLAFSVLLINLPIFPPVGHVCETEFATNMTFKVVTSILNFYIPTSCMVALYVRIFLAIRRRSRDIDRLGAYTANPSTRGQPGGGGKAKASNGNQARTSL